MADLTEIMNLHTVTLADIIDPVFERMCYMTQCVLRECCRGWREFPRPRIRDRVDTLIPAEILSHIDDCGGVIVGGCALACVNGGEFGDVDVLLNNDQTVKFKSVLGKLNAKLLGSGKCRETDEPIEHKLFITRKYELYGVVINTIESQMLAREYLNTFDFDFCKIAIARGKITIVCPDAVISRRSDHRFTGDVGILFYKITMGHRACDRVDKYTARGYTVMHADVDQIYETHLAAIKRARELAGSSAADADSVIAAVNGYIEMCRPIQAACTHMFVDEHMRSDMYAFGYRLDCVFGRHIGESIIAAIWRSMPERMCRHCLVALPDNDYSG
jgi:hypothetical protein